MRGARRIRIAAGLIALWGLILAAGIFVEARWFAEPNVLRADPGSIERELVDELRHAAGKGWIGSAALVLIQNGRIVAEHGFGVADAGSREAVRTDTTLFQVGSVSKAVTAWGVMTLVERGVLTLDEPVMPRLRRWTFPGSGAERDRVTVRHLLTHTAGLQEDLDHDGFEPGVPVPSLDVLFSPPGGPTRLRVTHDPGSAFAYSGRGGFALLQLLIEDVTGRPFAAFMDDAVLAPLGMTHAGFNLDALVASRKGTLAPAFDNRLRPQPPRRYAGGGAVALYTSARDLARFALAYLAPNAALKPDTVQLILTPQPATNGSWGLGTALFVQDGRSGHIAGHDGGAYPAWGAMMRIHPQTGNGIVLLVSGGRGALNHLVHEWVFWESGVVTREARWEVAFSRMRHALLAFIAGATALAWWAARRPAHRLAEDLSA